MTPSATASFRPISSAANRPPCGTHRRCSTSGDKHISIMTAGFASLRELIVAKLTSLHLGWTADEREAALDEVTGSWSATKVRIRNRSWKATTYSSFDRHMESISTSSLRWRRPAGVARCLADFIDSLRSPRTSAYDAFLELNRLPDGPVPGESIDQRPFAARPRHAARVPEPLEDTSGFGTLAVQGLKTFMRTQGPRRAAARRATLLRVYRRRLPQHGSLPACLRRAARRRGLCTDRCTDGRCDSRSNNSPQAGERPTSQRRPRLLELRHPRRASPRQAKPPDIPLVGGAFKTPTLRNLACSEPYMHNGAYRTLGEALRQKLEASRRRSWMHYRR